MTMQSFSDRDGTIWLDGRIVPWRDAHKHILTHGLHYASTVFEGERAYDGTIFKMRAHSERLIRSAALIDIILPYTPEQIDAAKEKTMRGSGFKDCYVRPFAWRGCGQMGISGKNTPIHLAIACWEWPSYYSAEKREKGIMLRTCPRWRAPMPNTAPTESKASCIYTTHTISKMEAESAGCDDALMLDYRGLVAEATSANIFMVKDGALKTPIPDCFLNGITRQTVISMARGLGLTVEEGRITTQELGEADEVFLTGTAAEVTAVGKIDDTSYTVGPITRMLRDEYAALCRKAA